MISREARRALSRGRFSRSTQAHIADKLTHRLTPQVCALWVPEAKGYLSEFGPHGFRVVEFAELAKHYTEDEASSAALAFREVTGLRVAVRPVYAHRAPQ